MLTMRFAQFKRGSGRRFVLVMIYFAVLSLLAIAITISHHKSSSNDLFRQPDETKVGVVKQDFRNQHCKTIHLAFICGRFNSTRNFYTLLKSILFYRTDILHLHIFIDNISHRILSEMFKTWIVPDLIVDFYNMTDHENEISWIASQHYSHRFGLMKLVFLPLLYEKRNLSKVILMDTDMLALGNINRVWEADKNLSNQSTKPIFGMVENQSDWYLGDTHYTGSQSVWPAIGRGFNSGLVLVNLIELDKQNWSQVWRQVAELELTSHLSTSLADQDIFNAVLRLHSHMVYELPCSFNLQLNDHTKLDETCPYRNSEFTLIHWNSPFKFLTKNSKAEYFRNWHLTFRNWNGKLLQQSFCPIVHYPPSPDYTASDNISDLDIVCKEIQPRPREKLRTFLYFVEFELEPVENDVTLVVHFSLDRLQTLDELASHWTGPISAAIYLLESETNLLLESIENSYHMFKRKNIGYHLVFRDSGFSYPINRLRNIALNNALTPYIFLSDIDFLPSTNLYQYLRETITSLKTKSRDNTDPLSKSALVVPAFENLQYKFEFPSSKAELLTQLNLGSISMFRDQIWPQGHAPTDYTKWRASTQLYKVDWKPEYEPFIVTGREVPKFDDRFVGFGWNKVEHIMQLAALDYEFFVLPEAFVIHKFHSASFDIMKHRESLKYRTCIKQLRRTFLVELRMKFPKFFRAISATIQPVNNEGALN